MTCAQHERTSAYLDGELDPAENAGAERHIETCAECQALVLAAERASEALRAPAARLVAPAGLRAEVMRGLAGEGERPRAPPPSRRGRDRFWLGAGLGAGATALAASLALVVAPLAVSESWTTQLADAHVRAMMYGRTIEVASSEHHTVKPWFAGRAPVSPPVRDFAGQGFTLVGGRVDRIGRERVAVVAYRHGAHEIDLFVWPKSAASQPGSADRRGYHVRTWTRGDLAFAAVSDTAPDELGRFETLVRAIRE